MAYLAQAHRAEAQLNVLDDRGNPETTLSLPAPPASPQDLDQHLREAGWERTADWTETSDGWQAPVLVG